MENRRTQIETAEAAALAPYGFRSRDSRGRVFAEPEHPFRTCFQRDRDRILHTTAFRRLEYKTQVFITGEGDYYRTRLTHTLEVAQVGRTLARALGGNEDLIEAICLAHDLGHPPFGHAGESALHRLMAGHGGFDHNRQSLRIVTDLERRYPDFPGLNLTWEVREGMVKHETEYDVSDAGEYEPEKRGHLEAQIANVADELAYTAHDLDDGLRSGLITPEQLRGGDLWDRLQQDISWQGVALQELDRHQIIRRLIDLQVTDIVTTAQEELTTHKIGSVEAVQRLSHNVVHFSDGLAGTTRQLKTFLYHNLYQHYRVVRMQVKAERFVEDLFRMYSENPAILPGEVQTRAADVGIARTISDYIAGMTDRYAVQELTKLTDPHSQP